MGINEPNIPSGTQSTPEIAVSAPSVDQLSAKAQAIVNEASGLPPSSQQDVVVARTIELMNAIGDVQDEIRKRKNAEDELRREHELNERLIDTAHAIILVLDPDGRIVRVNPFFEQLTGYSSDDVRGHDWFDMFIPEHEQSSVRDVFARSIGGNRTLGNINTIVTRAGSLKQIEWYDSQLRDTDGQLIGLLCVGLDITERVRAQQRSHESEERLGAVLNTVVDAIITIDDRGIIVHVNDATEKMFGYSRGEMVGENVKMLMPSPMRERHDGYIANYRATGEKKIIGIGRETVAQRKGGTKFPIDLAVSEVDHLGMFTGVIRDISDRKEMERHLSGIRSQERRRIAQDLHDGIGSHMAGTAMLAKTLEIKLAREGSPLVADTRELLGNLRDIHEKLRRLARGLMPIDVNDGLVAALGELAERYDQEGGPVSCVCRVNQSIRVHDPVVAHQVYQIVQEAVANAARHGNPKAVEIRMTAEGERVTVVVCDDGDGFQESSDSGRGMGLRTMRYRADQIGATLEIGPGDDGGSAVVCVFDNHDPTG